jgi:hypothetical protein
MIKRVAIEIIDHGLSNFDLPYKAIIGREYYVNFIRATKRLHSCYDFMEEAMLMECDKCQSFIIKLLPLCNLIEEVLESSEFGDYFGIIRRCYEQLGEGYYHLGEDSSEVAIIFDKHCSCNHVFVGEPEEKEDNQIDFGMPSGRVYKYVGPRRYWS